MTQGLKNLENMIYPGRIIIIGKDLTGKKTIVIYALTGRSPSSQARRLVVKGTTVRVEQAGKHFLKREKRDLLIYPALHIHRGIAVSNGKQTDDIKASLPLHESASEVLRSALQDWDYEPDAPNYTPRISGCVLPSGSASLGIIKRKKDGSSLREIFEILLKKGKGSLITTYLGNEEEPLQPFKGAPLQVELKGKSPQEMTAEVYRALSPRPQKKDYRVGVACLFCGDFLKNEFDLHIINRADKKRKNKIIFLV
ncbi:MAG: IMP cyclohydrolase [Candidatus Aminicenantales bacterium]